MLNIIIMLVVGSALAYISKYNLDPTSVNLGGYIISDVPLFYVIIASLLAGIILSYLLQLIHNFSHILALKGKMKEIDSAKGKILDLTKRVHQLELENERLKNSPAEPSDINAL